MNEKLEPPQSAELAQRVGIPPQAERTAFDAITSDLRSIQWAQQALGLSRATFWRFRKYHRIAVVAGRRISLTDLAAALECERCGIRRPATERKVGK